MAETSETERLRGLIDAGIALGSELSLDALLQMITPVAGALLQEAIGVAVIANALRALRA